MYVLMNALFKIPLGRIKRNGTVGKRPKYYKNPDQLVQAYYRLSWMQRMVIVPARMNNDGTYTRIHFTQENDDSSGATSTDN